MEICRVSEAVVIALDGGVVFIKRKGEMTMYLPKAVLLALGVCLLLGMVGSTQAALLNLSPEHYPLVYSIGASEKLACGKE